MLDDPVEKWMTPDPIVIGPETTLPEAYKLMTAAKVRRLPVVASGRLVGIITLGDLCEARPLDGETAGIFDINFELASLTVGKVMTRELITIPALGTIREAAKLLVNHQVSGLPVMKGQRLVGIITESDIFRLLLV